MFLKRRLAELLLHGHAGGRAAALLGELGPLRTTVEQAHTAERRRSPLLDRELTALFARFGDPAMTVSESLDLLTKLRPGGSFVGLRQVADLATHVRDDVRGRLDQRWGPGWALPDHDHAFGSGGDFFKTVHATTAACICVAALRPMCKTGTREVTSPHGSVQAARAFGYPPSAVDLGQLNRALDDSGFAFVSLRDLGCPYSDALVSARELFWRNWVCTLPDRHNPTPDWHRELRSRAAPIDLFKVVMPNLNLLGARHHSTGVYHLSLLPYVLAVYLRFDLRGMIVHGYDGIDEVSTASSDPTPGSPTTLVVRVERKHVSIAEIGPEDLGLPRSPLEGIRVTDLEGERAALTSLFAGAAGPHRDFVVANAGALLAAGGVSTHADSLVDDIRDGIRQASSAIDGHCRRPRAAVAATFPTGPTGPAEPSAPPIPPAPRAW